MNKQIFLLIFGLITVFNNHLYSQGSLSSAFKCVTNHVNNLSEKNYNPAQASKSFFVPDSAKSVDYAIKLKKVYDGIGLFVPLSRIPDNPNYIDSLSGKNKYVIFPQKIPEIYLEKIDTNWYYSPNCYTSIDKLYKEVFPFGSDLLRENLSVFGNRTILGLHSWQYVAFLLILILAVLLYFVFNLILKPVLIYIADKSFKTHLNLPIKYSNLSRIISLILVFYLIKYGIALLNLPIKLSAVFITSLDIIDIVLLSFLAYQIFDIILAFLNHLAKSTKSKMDDQVLPIVRQIVKLLIILVAVLRILVLLNINVTALIAGISIGGLALALAAQDTVRNFIGSLMIFIDQPFQVEDWIEIDDMAGTVIEVGFRSTRIKQLDTSIISIPNGIISNKALKNKGLRVFRIFETNLGVTYDTPREYLQTFIKGLRTLADKHPKVSEDKYIFLSNLGDYSINILFRVYLQTNEYKEELRLKEEITFQIMELAEHLGIRFAFPSQTLYVEQFPGQKDLIPEYPKQDFDRKLKEYFKNIERTYASVHE